ncbi:DMP19 family protein [Lacinutrix undariae]
MIIDINKLVGKNIDEKFDIINDAVYNRHMDYNHIEDFKNPLKNLVYLLNMKGQVDNGGITQFIDNATGDHFLETKLALKEIKMTPYLNILLEIEKTFPNNRVPKNQNERRYVIDSMCKTDEERWKIEETYEDYDTTFYKKEKIFKTKLIDYLVSFKQTVA